MESRLFVLLGPTAVGKTEIALDIAEMLGTPVINADSRQIYKHIPIGTAAPTAEQLRRVRHYFVGTLELDEYFSAARYEEEVLSVVRTLTGPTEDSRPMENGQRSTANGKNFLLTGGSMLYIDAVCNGIDDIPTVEADTRSLMRQRLAEDGLDKLCAELRLLDPEYYAKADLRNTQRIVHALEICYQTGRPYSSFLGRKAKPRPFRVIKVGLCRPREELFDRINRRTLEMLDLGFEQEARAVYHLRHLNSLNTVGYKEMFRYFDGDWTLEQAVEKIQRNTRVYAKKQMTWFQRDHDINWFRPDEEKKILDFVKRNSAD